MLQSLQLKITTPPTQLEYTMGEEKLNLEGMVVTATDKDGKTSVVKITHSPSQGLIQQQVVQ